VKKYLLLFALCTPAIAQTTFQPANFPVFRALDKNGKPLSGGLLFSYAAGTTTPLATYTDAGGLTPNTQPVVLDSTGTARVYLGTSAYKLVLQDQFGVQQWVVDNLTGTLQSIIRNPLVDQTITQPINTNFTVNTSGTGASIFNGNVLLNYNQVQNALNYFNYRYSSSNFQSPLVAATGRTWANPEFYYAVNDNSAQTTNPNPQGDLQLTPIIHIESFNNSPNDSAPIYLQHRCTNSAPGTRINGCVGVMAAVSSTPTAESFLEAANFIVQIGSTDPLVQAQGVELNQFNNSGVNSLLQATNTFTRGPYLGMNATAGGANKMVAGFHTTDQGGTSGWQYGFWSEQATDADFMAGFPGGQNGPQDALQASPAGTVAVGHNIPSMPIDLRSMYNDGTVNHVIANLIQAIPLDNSTNPVICTNVSFSGSGTAANICNDGSLRMRGISWRTFNGAPAGNCNPGDFATNASPINVNTVFYVCFPANVWNPK
jgi:hypothetical protein